jgi:hypothetical protein
MPSVGVSVLFMTDDSFNVREGLDFVNLELHSTVHTVARITSSTTALLVMSCRVTQPPWL